MIINSSYTVFLPPVWSGVYVNAARLLKYTLEEMGAIVNIADAGMPEEGAVSIVLGWDLIPESTVFYKPYILYQLEPLDFSIWQNKLLQKAILFRNAMAIWDYSELNVEHLKRNGFSTQVVPFGYHARMEEVVPCRYPDYDVLFVGFITERRKKILDELQRHCCISVQPRWGKDFLEVLGRSKIILNIHQYDFSTPLEQPRISYALNNAAFVISETAGDNPYPQLLSCHYSDLVSMVLHYLRNPMERAGKKEEIYRSYKATTMKDILNSIMRPRVNVPIPKTGGEYDSHRQINWKF